MAKEKKEREKIYEVDGKGSPNAQSAIWLEKREFKSDFYSIDSFNLFHFTLHTHTHTQFQSSIWKASYELIAVYKNKTHNVTILS